MATYGITIGVPQLVLTLLANIKTGTKSEYGHKFRSAMHPIRKKYTYNHVHDAASPQNILTELAGADGVRILKDAPAPSAGTAHSVANSVSFLYSMMDRGDTNSEYIESVYSATFTSESSEEERKPRGRNRNKGKQSKSRGKQEKKKKKDNINAPAKNTCPHCKKFQCRKPYRVNPDKCMWNKNLRNTISNPSATSSRWLSSHATSLRRNWVGTQKKKIRRANDSAQRQRMLRGRMIWMDGPKLNGRTVVRTK
jgi:hypothetical protein